MKGNSIVLRRTAQRLFASVGVIGTGSNSCQSNHESGDMSDGVQIGGAMAIMDPKPLLTGVFETGVITFAFGSQRVNTFEL